MSNEHTANPESIRDRIKELNASVASGERTIIIDDCFPNHVLDSDLTNAFEIFKVRCEILKKDFDEPASLEAFMWGCRLMARLVLLDQLEPDLANERSGSLIEQIEHYYNEKLKPFPKRKGADNGMLDFDFFYESMSKSSDSA